MEKMLLLPTILTGTKLKLMVILYLFSAFFPPRPSNSAKSSPNSLSRSLRLMKLGYFTIPSTFDWRTYGKVTPVKDQGNCGSCWSFSSTAQYESAIAIATNGTLYDLSE